MTTMFIICGILSTIVVIFHVCSRKLAGWLIRSDLGGALSAVYSTIDENIQNEFSSLSKEEVLNEIVILHCQLHKAMKEQKFNNVEKLNYKIYVATCKFTDFFQ